MNTTTKKLLTALSICGLLSGVTSIASAQNYQVKWNDHRAIGNVMIAVGAASSATNPRGYLWDKTVDVSNLTAFQQRMLNFADNSIQVLKNMNAQGMITWDLEGEQAPQPITYIGDPRVLPRVAPEMDSIADAYFKKFRDAGLKVGICIRPQQIQLDSNNVPVAQNSLSTDSAIANLLIDKISYARQRWGATIFYVDSNVYGNGIALPSSIFQTVLNAFPDILLVPEQHQDIGYWAVSAPYVEPGLVGRCNTLCAFVNTPAEVKAVYPQAWSVINSANANLSGSFSQLVQGVSAGDSILFHGWYDDQPTNGQVQQIYAAATPYVPPVTEPAPTVSITSPLNGSVVSGTVAASATAGTGTTKLEFYLDGALVATDTATPYNYSWNTSQTANGSHTLMAKAYNSAGSFNTSSVSVTVNNTVTVPPSSSTFLINSGGSTYTSGTGQVWSADSNFTGGQVGTTTAAISNTPDPALYQSDRFGSFDYNMTVPNGNYTVNLKFAETYFTTAGKRVFSVAINGKTVLSNFDIVAQAGASFKAIDKPIPVSVTDGKINIHMIPITENPMLNAIQVIPQVSAFSPIRVNAGGPNYTDPMGQIWSADTGFTGGGIGSTTAAISQTNTPVLYQTERFGTQTYQFTAPNGSYNVTLKFAEAYFTQSGKRVFNVVINGQKVETNFDIFAAAGGKNVAIDKSYPVSVSNGQVTIQLLPVIENPLVNAIEIK
jgi:hypothetical protein